MRKQLEDEERLFDLAFLVDITCKLSDMNPELQGKNKRIAETMSTVSSYKSKFELMTDLTNNTFIVFLIRRNIWANTLILFFRQRSMLPKSVIIQDF
jgi:hypothetical protein